MCSSNSTRTQRAGVYEILYWTRDDRTQCAGLHYRRGYWKSKQFQTHEQKLWIARAVFSSWRMWARIHNLADEWATAEAKQATIHSAVGPWWLQ